MPNTNTNRNTNTQIQMQIKHKNNSSGVEFSRQPTHSTATPDEEDNKLQS